MGSDRETDRPDEREGEGQSWAVEVLRADLQNRPRSKPKDPERQERKIPQSRIGRSAKLGTAIGTQATKYAGTAAANVVRGEEKSQERIETRHIETALKMASTLGEMKGAAMKIGQMASIIDVDFLPPEYREIYQDQLSKLRTHAPAMPWEKVRTVLEEEYEERPESVFASIEEEAFAAASIGQVHRATLRDGSKVAVKIQYPGVADALESDVANMGILLRLARALAPGLDAKAVASELRERVLEELDYEFEAQNQRSFARAYDGHPFIFVPKVHSRLSRRRVLVTDYVEGRGFDEVKELEQDERDIFGEIVFRFCFGSIYHLQHFNADTHPGNYLLMEDGRVAFLDFGMTKQLDKEQIELEITAVEAVLDDSPERLREALGELGFVRNPKRVDAERLMEHVKTVGGWYMRDEELTIDSELVMRAIAPVTDPRSDFFDMMRRENIPANELMGRRMESGVLAVLGQLGATRNWMRIGREWWFADEPATELGREEWAYWEDKGGRRRRKVGARVT